MAEHFFAANDDLATDLPERDDRPAAQNWDSDRNGNPLARQWSGDYSWIVTVVPTTTAARKGLARNPEAFAYDVSVVVFYKRTLPEKRFGRHIPLTGQDDESKRSAIDGRPRARRRGQHFFKRPQWRRASLEGLAR